MRQALLVSAKPSKKWTINHFSQANPKGAGRGDVPRLLRRVADTIEKLGKVEIQDIVMHSEITESGDWYSMTVYYYNPVTKPRRNRS